MEKWHSWKMSNPCRQGKSDIIKRKKKLDDSQISNEDYFQNSIGTISSRKCKRLLLFEFNIRYFTSVR